MTVFATGVKLFVLALESGCSNKTRPRGKRNCCERKREFKIAEGARNVPVDWENEENKMKPTKIGSQTTGPLRPPPAERCRHFRVPSEKAKTLAKTTAPIQIPVPSTPLPSQNFKL